MPALRDLELLGSSCPPKVRQRGPAREALLGTMHGLGFSVQALSPQPEIFLAPSRV